MSSERPFFDECREQNARPGALPLRHPTPQPEAFILMDEYEEEGREGQPVTHVEHYSCIYDSEPIAFTVYTSRLGESINLETGLYTVNEHSEQVRDDDEELELIRKLRKWRAGE